MVTLIETYATNVARLTAELDAAQRRITTLESEFTRGREMISRLLADDLRNSEKLSELKEMTWLAHRGLSVNCKCDVCDEVAESWAELGGLI